MPTAPAVSLTSAAEMDDVFSADGVTNHSADLADNTAMIQRVIYESTERALSYLRGKYEIAALADSYWVREKVTYIACYLLSIRRGNPSLYYEQYEMAMSELMMARDGVINIGVSIASGNRITVQTPVIDSRFYNQSRINSHGSNYIQAGQAAHYGPGGFFG